MHVCPEKDWTRKKWPRKKMSLRKDSDVFIWTRGISTKHWSTCSILPLVNSFSQVIYFSRGTQSQIFNKKYSMTRVSVVPAIVPDGAFVSKSIIDFNSLHLLPLIVHPHLPGVPWSNQGYCFWGFDPNLNVGLFFLYHSPIM